MTEEENIHRIYRFLEGDMTREEQEDFLQELENNASLAKIYREICQIKDQLEKEVSFHGHVDLKAEVLKQINMESYKQPPKKDNVRISVPLWRNPVLMHSLTFAAGILAGLLIFSFYTADITGDNSGQDSMAGTLLEMGKSGSYKSADVVQYTSPQVDVAYNVRYTTEVVEMEIDLSSPEAVKTMITFDYRNFAVYNIRNINVNELTTAFSAGNYVQINNTGANKFLIVFANKNSLANRIEIRVLKEDAPVYQNFITINKEN